MAYTLLSNSPVTGEISWAGVHLVYDGVDYAITDGYTDKRFVYWLLSSPTVLQVSDTMPTLGQDDTIVFLNKSGVAINVLNSTALEGDLVVPGTVTANAIATDAIVSRHIQSDAITSRHIIAGAITADHIVVDSLQAISANMGDITSGTLTVDQAGFIRGGQIAYRDGRGFWMGHHEGTYKLSYKGASGVEFLFDGDGIGVYDASGSPILTATGVPYSAVTDTPTSLSQINSSESEKLASVDTGATRNVFKGPWWTGTSYVVGDVVTDDGSSWSCIADHTSSDTNRPPTLPTTENTYWTLYAAKGDKAADAITGLLTNETATLPASYEGVVSDFSSASGKFVVYSGVEDVTAFSTFSIPTGGQTNCTGSISAGGDYSVTEITADSAVLKLQASYNGTVITKEFSLAKSRAGNTGSAAAAYWVTSDQTTVKKNDDGTISPSSITISATTSVGESVTSYAGRFIVQLSYDGFSYSTAYTSAVDESSTVFALPAGITGVKIKLYKAGDFVTLLDEGSVAVVSNGITYDVKIESTNGDVFRVGQSTTTILKALVFRNGVDVTDQIPESRFQWKRVSFFPQGAPYDDDTWNAKYATGYKQVQINVDSVYSRATFTCNIVE